MSADAIAAGTWRSLAVPGNWTMQLRHEDAPGQAFTKPHYTNIQMPFSEHFPHVLEHTATGVYRRPARLEARAFGSDLNVFWDIGGKPPMSANGGYDAEANWITHSTFTVEQLQELGYDRHSVIAEPCCADLDGFDFTLAEDSPAFALGFEAIDMSAVGPRAAGSRED